MEFFTDYGFGNTFILEALPPGYRFKPTNEELFDYYLINKVLGLPLPPNNIKVVELYKFHPRKLSEMYESIGENEWYFFTSREKKYPNGSRPNRSISGTGDDKDVGGFWKASGADVKIYSHGKLVGYKKVLVFHEGKPKNRADVKKTNWIMYEFRVADEYIIPTIRAPGDTKLDDCILCMIYENSKRHDANNQQLDHSQNHQDTVMIPNTNQARYIGFENLQQQLPNLPCNNIQWNDHMTYFGVDGMNLQLESSHSQPSEAEISSNPFV